MIVTDFKVINRYLINSSNCKNYLFLFLYFFSFCFVFHTVTLDYDSFRGIIATLACSATEQVEIFHLRAL